MKWDKRSYEDEYGSINTDWVWSSFLSLNQAYSDIEQYEREHDPKEFSDRAQNYGEAIPKEIIEQILALLPPDARENMLAAYGRFSSLSYLAILGNETKKNTQRFITIRENTWTAMNNFGQQNNLLREHVQEQLMERKSHQPSLSSSTGRAHSVSTISNLSFSMAITDSP